MTTIEMPLFVFWVGDAESKLRTLSVAIPAFCRPDYLLRIWLPQGIGVIATMVLCGVFGFAWNTSQAGRAFVAILVALSTCFSVAYMMTARSPVDLPLFLLSVSYRFLTCLAFVYVSIKLRHSWCKHIVGFFEKFGDADLSDFVKGSRQVSKKQGFTVFELLVTVTILLVLAGIVAAVFPLARKSAKTSAEFNQIRQVYVATTVYSVDHDSRPALTLGGVTPRYLAYQMLTCPSDVRQGLNLQDWPTNIWANISPADSKETIKERSPKLVSYAYLGAFRDRFPVQRAFYEYVEDPNVGTITGLGLMQCADFGESSSRLPGCIFDEARGKDHPPINLEGRAVTMRTDGSAFVREFPFCGPVQLGPSDLFLNLKTHYDCEPRPIP